jgi:hypothetical protein
MTKHSSAPTAAITLPIQVTRFREEPSGWAAVCSCSALLVADKRTVFFGPFLSNQQRVSLQRLEEFGPGTPVWAFVIAGSSRLGGVASLGKMPSEYILVHQKTSRRAS